MIDETITKLQQRLQAADALNDQTRQDLLQLLNTLKTEVSELSKTHSEQAHRILGYAQSSTQQATEPQQNADLLQRSLQDLSTSVDGFEKSHPRLVQIVNRIAETLSNLGI